MKVLSNSFIWLFILLIFILIDTFTATAQEDYETWLKQQQQAVREFKDKRDRAFSEFLKQEWHKFQVFQGLNRDEKPKPKKIPKAEPRPLKDITPPKIRVIKDIPMPKISPPDKPDLDEEPAAVDIEKGESIKVKFFDTPLKMNYDRALQVPRSKIINKETISAYWSATSRTDYERTLKRAQYFKNKLQLNDWGYGYLLYRIGAKMYPDSRNQRNLFVWFMLSKSGYKTKIAYTSDQIYLLLTSANFIYSIPYVNIDDKNYFVVSFDGILERVKTLYTYEGQYPNADKVIGLKFETLPNFKYKVASKKLKFIYRGKEYILEVKYNKTLVSFLKYYPQTNLEVYFEAPVSSEASYSLLNALKLIVEGKPETEAVNMLLRFVQTAFDYKTDGDQFGREKYFFSEETLFYPYSDCEDRSILFAYLVRNLVGLEVIGLDYPGHVATAVQFSADVSGDYVVYKNKKYIICDPTYINANLGMRMPQLKDAEPEVIQISFNMREHARR